MHSEPPIRESAALAKCACGTTPSQWKYFGVYHVSCCICHAATPDYKNQALAAAAWNRMMVEPLSETAARIMKGVPAEAWKPTDDARHLLSALADELVKREQYIVAAAVRSVLSGKPKA